MAFIQLLLRFLALFVPRFGLLGAYSTGINGFGYHILVDRLSPWQIERLFQHLRIVQPAWVNVTAAAQFKEGMQLIERLRAEFPAMGIIWRAWGNDYTHDMFHPRQIPIDNGVFRKMSPIDWYNLRIKPHVEWIKRFNVVVMTDNESLEEDMRLYAQWMAEVMALAKADGIRLAFCRTSTGNPREWNYAEMDQAWRAAAEGNHIYSPNEGTDPHPQFRSGQIGRFLRAWARFLFYIRPFPITVIGEYAYAVFDTVAGHVDAHRGWRLSGLTGFQYARLLIDQFKMWYAPYGVAVCIFCYGIWNETPSFGTQPDQENDESEMFLREVEAAARRGELRLHVGVRPIDPAHYLDNTPPPPPPPDNPPPPDDPSEKPPLDTQEMRRILHGIRTAVNDAEELIDEAA
ncbi:hypothetical protein Rctr85_097 [Virus Rctr85]|nr:hypothetical protein Rctr85_097 [Virus Rctr85]